MFTHKLHNTLFVDIIYQMYGININDDPNNNKKRKEQHNFK